MVGGGGSPPSSPDRGAPDSDGYSTASGYPGKWACMLDEGKDISVQDLLMHMEKTFGNKRNYDAMIRTLYEVQQKEDETVEEYMLRMHDMVTVIRCVYPKCLSDRGRDLKKYHFYHGLHPYLHDALSFAMVELPEGQQACPTFDTLYTLTKKLEAGQLAHTHWYTASSDVYREKHRCYPMLAGRVAGLEEEGLVSTDPVSGEDSESKVEAVDALNVHLAQAMSHYQREEQKCFMCGLPGHFARDCPHCDAFKRWHQEQIWDPLLEAGGPVSHWIGPETLVDLTIEGRNVDALADSGSEVNMIMPALVQQHGFPVLPLGDLVDYPLNLVGLGGKRTSMLDFVILHIQVQEIAGYDEDVVFLVVADESEFGQRVPLVIGTCTIGRIISVIWESEIDHLSMPWATVRMVQLLSCWKSTVVLTSGSAETQLEGASGGPQEMDMDELVTVRESVRLGLFQTEIIEGQVKPLLGDTSHVMITPLRVEGQPREGKLLPPGLHVLHAYTCLKNGNSKVSLVVRNISDSHIFLKKGVLVAWVVPAFLVLPAELSPEMEAALGAES